MPTMHFISREVYEKYQDVIDRLPGEMNDDLTGSISSNKRVKTTASTTADDDDPTSVEATCNAIFNTRTTGTSSDGPNTSIADADGGKPSAGQNTSDFGSDCNDSTVCFSGGEGDNLSEDDVDDDYDDVEPSKADIERATKQQYDVDANGKPSAGQTTSNFGSDCDDSTGCFSEGDDDNLSDDYVDDDDDDDEPSKADIERAMKQQSKILSDISRDDLYESIFQYVKQHELCCIKCNCGDGDILCKDYDSACIFKEVLPSQTSSSYYARIHRWCCPDIHSLCEYDQEYARTNYFNALCGGCKKERTKNGIFHIKNSCLLKAKKNANRLKTTVDNNIYKDPVAWRETDDRYNENRKLYKVAKDKANLDGLKAANVLSLFSGIGAGILVLKRLNIAICNCVVVEHDSVAEIVCAANHKTDVNEYIWIKTFEELEQTLDTVMTKYGPFDIVEGGPPCTEYSAVNANRTGMKSVKGQYMLKFAQLIKRIKNHPEQKGKHVFFLCENVESMKDDDVMKFEDDFGISRVNIDAQCLSPTKRARSYFTNIPMDELPLPDSAAALSGVDFLTDRWMDPVQLYSHIHREPVAYSKAYTVMASPYRIDHKERMIKVRLHDDLIEATHYTVEDREMLMGFPKGYVECVVKRTFERAEESFQAEDWLDNADKKDWDFDELCSFSARSYKWFKCSDSNKPKLSKIGTVDKLAKDDKKSLYYFDSDGYCKRLLGNSYSIPVVEHILRPLCGLFLPKKYSVADYCFAWQADKG